MFSFLPKPLRFNLQAIDPDQRALAGRSACLDLSAKQVLPSGWYLLRGSLRRQDMTSSARLTAVVRDLQEQVSTLPIPVSRKGTIFELLHLSNGCVNFALEPTRAGSFDLQNISLSPVGKVERVVRMYRRVVPMLFKMQRARRHKAGLRSYTLLLDLPKAYRIASRFRDYSPELTYEKWLHEYDLLAEIDKRLIRRHIKSWEIRPSFKIFIVVTGNNIAPLNNTLDSLHKQLYRNFTVTLLISPQSNINIEFLKIPTWAAIYKANSVRDLLKFANAKVKRQKRPAWIFFLRDGALLAEHALYWFGNEALNDSAAFIYSDHDSLKPDGTRGDPVFKPDWSHELLRSTNYIGCSAAVRSDVLQASGGVSMADIQNGDNHDLFLRISEHADSKSIRHLPAILYHHPVTATEHVAEDASRKSNPVSRHIRRSGVAATVQRITTAHYRVRYSLPETSPMVSIIVPTKDALTHLRACVESVLDTSSYQNFELLVIDNQSADPKTLGYLEDLKRNPRVRVLRYNRPFNYSAINNYAARHANGNVLCLLNNDTEVISPGWMEEMLGHLLQPGVGVVGAKLYYGDGRVQHAGDTVGPGGCAHHLHALIERDDPGYCNRAILAQDLSAVTAACLMTWATLFNKLGGLDRKSLPIAFNDVDYCLRVREQGLRVVWTPYAELYHHESISRGKENTPEKIAQMKREIAFMRRRWRHLMSHDPFYNPNLNYDRPDFSLNVAPMIKKPWRN